MLIGVPKEIKNHEYRVGLTPSSVNELVKRGHGVIVERNAGAAIDFPDAEYQAAGAEMVDSANEIFARADMVVKVKEPQPAECKMLREARFFTLTFIWHQTRNRRSYCWPLAQPVLPMRR